jgi:hypothetical protein
VTIPIFQSASSAAAAAAAAAASADGVISGATAPSSHTDWGSMYQSANDPMDFDLLAEYLLEDNTGSLHGDPTFDFIR